MLALTWKNRPQTRQAYTCMLLRDTEQTFSMSVSRRCRLTVSKYGHLRRSSEEDIAEDAVAAAAVAERPDVALSRTVACCSCAISLLCCCWPSSLASADTGALLSTRCLLCGASIGLPSPLVAVGMVIFCLQISSKARKQVGIAGYSLFITLQRHHQPPRSNFGYR